MLKTELVSRVAAEAGISKVAAETAINAVFYQVSMAIKLGRQEISGFGVFKRVRRAATSRPNPQDRTKKVHVPAHNTVKFKPAPSLKGLMNP